MEESQLWILLQRLRREKLELEMVVCKFFFKSGDYSKLVYTKVELILRQNTTKIFFKKCYLL